MDPKTWLWKKKSSEKTAALSDKVNGEESPGARKVAELEKCMETLNQKLSSALSECKAKDELALKQLKQAEDTLEGWEKTKSEAKTLKQDLEKALQQRVIAEERISHLDAALKECMQQLRFVREEQEQRIHDAVKKTTLEQEKIQLVLEKKLEETNKKLSDLGMQNSHLVNTIQIKDEMIEDLRDQNSQADEDYKALKARLDLMQKDNASMNYELRMLEKELEIRNEEREFNRRSNDASHKQHLESVKKIANLESECQKLRLLVQKRLPGPAALARMKNEVDMLGVGKGGSGLVGLGSPTKDFSPSPNKKVNYLIERLCSIEEENKTLKEAMSKKTSELELSRSTYSHTASKLSEVEAQLVEMMKEQATPRNVPTSRRLSFASETEINQNEDTESWASMRIRQSPSCKAVGSSDMSLMDDFAEMEKLAIVCVEKSSEEKPKATSIEDIKTALADMARTSPTASIDEKDKTSTNQLRAGLGESISKIVELMEKINHQSSKENSFPGENGSYIPNMNSGYTYRVFQWKSTELNHVLRQFVHTCNDLLSGQAEFENFAGQLSSTFEWVMNHCFSLQDVSSMKDTIKKHFDWDESRSESEHGEKPQVAIEVSQAEESLLNLNEEIKRLKDELTKVEAEKEDSGATMANLQTDFETLRVSKEMLESEIENQKLLNEDLNVQLTTVKDELKELQEKFSSLEEELEERNNSCRELETTCLDQQIQLESLTKEEEKERQAQNGWEITAASEKLAECQETILNLGKQLKALSAPRVISVNNKSDGSEDEELESPEMKEIICTMDSKRPSNGEAKPLKQFTWSLETKYKHDSSGAGALAIIPSKKRGGGMSFLKKLLSRRKKETSSRNKRISLPMNA